MVNNDVKNFSVKPSTYIDIKNKKALVNGGENLKGVTTSAFTVLAFQFTVQTNSDFSEGGYLQNEAGFSVKNVMLILSESPAIRNLFCGRYHGGLDSIRFFSVMFKDGGYKLASEFNFLDCHVHTTEDVRYDLRSRKILPLPTTSNDLMFELDSIENCLCVNFLFKTMDYTQPVWQLTGELSGQSKCRLGFKVE